MPAISFLRADFGPPPPQPAVPQYQSTVVETNLAGYIRTCFDASKQHRQNIGVEQRMLAALRAMRGEYDSATLQDIAKFGGSQVYARITASKVRGTSALLREIYTASDRPWGLSPTPDPLLAGPSLQELVSTVLQAEAAELVANGQPVDPQTLQARAQQLREELQQKRKKAATDALRVREQVLDDILWEGGFYDALWAALGDIATFPIALIKGPIVRNKNVLRWNGNVPAVEKLPTMTWERCSPFDVYFAPWSNSIQDGYIIHRERVSRTSVQALIGLQAYNTEAIQRVLDNWGSQSTDWYDYIESERADLENRESQTSPTLSARASDRPMPMLSFYGSVSGQLLVEWGMDPSQVPDTTQDLEVMAYLIGSEVIGVTVNPHPTGRKPFYGDCFERVPGSVYGNAIPDLIEDIQAVGNAALRSLVNNLAIASGPMGWINEDRVAENDANADKLWPWKIFRFTDPQTSGNSEEPMKFFQPDANIQPLFTVYQQMLNMADEITTLPRYMQGSGQGVGGAGRTAAGLSMLMEASNRTIKQTVTSIDSNMVEPCVEDLNVWLALTRPDVVVEGDISVVAKGATELMQRETMRMRRLEFLNITNNPVDQQLVGIEGRYHLLREIARDLNMPLSDTLPLDDATVKTMQQMLLQQAMTQTAAGTAMAQAQGAAAMQGGAQPGQMPAQSQQQAQASTKGVARPQANSPS